MGAAKKFKHSKSDERPLVTILFAVAFFGVLMLIFQTFDKYWIFTTASFAFLFLSIVFLSTFWENSLDDPKPKRYPSLTIAVPTYNSEATIVRCIKAIKAMKYPKPFEIVVVDDSSTDGTYNLIKNEPGVKIIRRTKNRGKASAINLVINGSKAELLANIDSDTFPEKDALMNMVGYFNDPKVGAVTTIICADNPKKFLEKVQEIEYFVAFGFWHKALSFLNGLLVTPGPMSIYRRNALLEAGGFDEENITEDMEVALHLQSLGYKIACSINTKVFTPVPDNLKDYFRQRIRWYRGKVFNGRKYKFMLFNRKYGEFGSFVYPATFMIEFLSIVVLFGVIFLNLEVVYSFLVTAFLTVTHEAFYINLSRLLEIDLLMVPPYFILFAEMAIIWGIMTMISFKFVARRIELRMLPYFAFYMMFYSFFITASYLMGMLKDINRSENIW